MTPRAARSTVESGYGGKCETVLGNNGEGWKSVAVSQWWLNLKGAATKHVLVSPYGISEILMGGISKRRNQ